MHGPVKAKECTVSHDTRIPQTPSAFDIGAVAATSASAASSGLEQQRRALQRQVEVLRLAGALPSAADAGQPASAVQWNNWSNG